MKIRYSFFLFLVSAGAFAQQALEFEVASVKLKDPRSPITMVGGGPSGPRLTFEAMSLSDLIAWAYNVKVWQIAGGPAWAGVQRDRTKLDSGERRFDIAAKAPGDAEPSRDEFRQMLQALLTDRFHLVTHRESRDTNVYALVTDKKGPKFKEGAPDAKGFLRMYGGGKITGSGATMTMLAGWFSNANGVDRPVLDQTGLAGKYDFSLEWSNPLAGATDDPTAPSIFTALQEQLGLKLEPKRAPMEILVIDRAELPGDN